MPNNQFFNEKFDQLVSLTEQNNEVNKETTSKIEGLASKIQESANAGEEEGGSFVRDALAEQQNRIVDEPDVTLADVLRQEFSGLKQFFSSSQFSQAQASGGGQQTGHPDSGGGGSTGLLGGIGGAISSGLGVLFSRGFSGLAGKIISSISGGLFSMLSSAGSAVTSLLSPIGSAISSALSSAGSAITSLLFNPITAVLSSALAGFALGSFVREKLEDMDVLPERDASALFRDLFITPFKRLFSGNITGMFSRLEFTPSVKKAWNKDILPAIMSPFDFLSSSFKVVKKGASKGVKAIKDFFLKDLPTFFAPKNVKKWLGSIKGFFTKTIPSFLTTKKIKSWFKPIKDFFVKDVPGFLTGFITKAKNKLKGLIPSLPSASSLNPFSSSEETTTQEEGGQGRGGTSGSGSQSSGDIPYVPFFDTPGVIKSKGEGLRAEFAPGDFVVASQSPVDLAKTVGDFVSSKSSGGGKESTDVNAEQTGFKDLALKFQKAVNLLTDIKDNLESGGGDVVAVPSDEPSRESFSLASMGG